MRDRILIGKYRISNWFEDGDDTELDSETVWIEDTTTGEGGTFSKSSLAEVIHVFYKDHF